MSTTTKVILENLRRYRNLWWAEYHVIAGEEIYSALVRQIGQLDKRNKELEQEILQLRERGKS